MRVASEACVGVRTAGAAVTSAQRAPSAHAQRVRARAPSEERAAFERAVLPLLPGLRLFLLRLSQNAPDADDLLQDAVLRAWRFWPRYVERDHCRAWLQRIVSNGFFTERRRQTRRRLQLRQFEVAWQVSCAAAGATGPLPADLDPPHEPDQRQWDERLRASIDTLTSEQRAVLWVVDVRERSYREAAAELACPIGTVMSRLHRARAALRVQLTASAANA
jgi:RNA polymerase sigma-70 factor (ECF subfamily)